MHAPMAAATTQRGEGSFGYARSQSAVIDGYLQHPASSESPSWQRSVCWTFRTRQLVIAVTLGLSMLGLLVTVASAQWPVTCVDLNDIVESHLGNYRNVGIYQRVFGSEAEQACRNDHRDDVRRTFAWAVGDNQPSEPTQPAGQASDPSASTNSDGGQGWPVTCVALNDIVESHLGNEHNVGIYQRVFGNQAEQPCRQDHRDDVRRTFAWAIGDDRQQPAASVQATGSVQPTHWMPDPVLRQAVRNELELPAAVLLTKERIERLRFLDGNHKGISDLTGLEHAINLRELHLGGTENRIGSVRPLSKLIHLRELHIWGDDTPLDIEPLGGLTNLEVLVLESRGIKDISLIARMTRLKELWLGYNLIEDVSPLASLSSLWMLHLNGNPIRDLEPIRHLHISDLSYDWICATMAAPSAPRIDARTFPSVALPGGSLVDINAEPVRWLSKDDENYYEEATKHDLSFFQETSFDLWWHLTSAEPTHGLSTRLYGDADQAMSFHREYTQRNPDMLFLFTIAVRIHGSLDEFPPDSDFWLRDADGQIVANEVPWSEWVIDILNPEVQQLIINRIVAVAECGLFDGVMFDGIWPQFWSYYGFGTDAEYLEATTAILRGVRARVRDDFLILNNGNRRKMVHWTEWINGSLMETNIDYPGGYTHEGLVEIEEALLWNETHLREPTINVLQGEGVEQPIDGPDNRRWMRVFTAMALTHSDGYVVFRAPQMIKGYIQGSHIWYDFWDADLGTPVGETGKQYDSREGLFIREFTNGWAVYNRSGQAQEIRLPQIATGVASGVTGHRHTVPDLDGEIFLKK